MALSVSQSKTSTAKGQEGEEIMKNRSGSHNLLHGIPFSDLKTSH